MKKRKNGRDESALGNDGDDEGFESSPEKVKILQVFLIVDYFEIVLLVTFKNSGVWSLEVLFFIIALKLFSNIFEVWFNF